MDTKQKKKLLAKLKRMTFYFIRHSKQGSDLQKFMILIVGIVCIDNVTTHRYHVSMNKQDTIQIRIDSKTKEAARKTLDELGIDMSSAVKLFLTNVVHRKGIPLDLLTENGFTLAQEQALILETELAKNSAKRFATVDALMKDLEK